MKYLLLTFFSIILSSHSLAFDHKHSLWDQITQKYVIRKGLQTSFNYKALKDSKVDMKKFDQYLSHLSTLNRKEFLSLSSQRRMSFLINAYNAFTVKLIINHYPVKSIKKIGGWFSSPWKIKFFNLLEEKTYLDHIEHGMLRKMFKEPRIHYAVNCASIGCPNLQNKAFTGENLESLLRKGEKEFLSDNSKNRIDVKNKTIHLSKIFKWFSEDFVNKYGSVENYISDKFEQSPNVIKMLKSKRYKISYTDYDWSLNKNE